VNRIVSFLALTTAAVACGCTTLVQSERASATTEGIEYSLPVPVIRVTPQADGTMAVAVDYLPDPDATYVLRTASFGSSYTLDVQRENGMLKSVSLDAKADDVAKSVIEAQADLVKARQDAAVKDRDEAAAAAAEQAKTLGAAKLALAVAEAKLEALESNNATADQLLAARLEVAGARATLGFLRGAAGGSNAAALRPSALAPDQLGNDSKEVVAAAPVLFRVVPVKPEPKGAPWGVRLQAFDGPRFLPTARIEAAPAAPPAARLEIDGPNDFEGQGTGPVTLAMKVNRTIAKADVSTSMLRTVKGNVDFSDRIAGVNANTRSDGSAVFVTLRQPIPPGRYELAPALFDAAGKAVSVSVDITIH
jgi:hypothetical protein